MSTSIYDFTCKTLRGADKPLSDYTDKVVLVVNTASKCGFTPQYEGLEKLHEDLGDKGLSILGFPCNQFGKQEAGSDSDIGEFCQINYGVGFDMFSKIDVNGEGADPLYGYLKDAGRGVLGSKRIKWNFTKFLVGKDGKVIKRYGSSTKPSAIRSDIEALL